MLRIIIPVIAGILAGLATGFSGLSAATFISPMLVSFLCMNSFDAIGIALASDVLASLVSFITYFRNGNTEIKKGKYVLVSVVLFSVVGTAASFLFTSSKTNDSIMAYWLIISSALMGLKLIFKPGDDKGLKLPFGPVAVAILAGSYVGFVCGFQGTGGGLMMLFVLNIMLGFEFKKAVGTSVAIMTFTALVGSISHFIMADGISDIPVFIICVVSTLVSAEIAAVLANRMDPIKAKKITGLLMVISGVITFIARTCLN